MALGDERHAQAEAVAPEGRGAAGPDRPRELGLDRLVEELRVAADRPPADEQAADHEADAAEGDEAGEEGPESPAAHHAFLCMFQSSQSPSIEASPYPR